MTVQEWMIVVATWLAVGAVFDMIAEAALAYRDFTGRAHRVTTFVYYCALGPLTIPLVILFFIRELRRRR